MWVKAGLDLDKTLSMRIAINAPSLLAQSIARLRRSFCDRALAGRFHRGMLYEQVSSSALLNIFIPGHLFNNQGLPRGTNI